MKSICGLVLLLVSSVANSTTIDFEELDVNWGDVHEPLPYFSGEYHDSQGYRFASGSYLKIYAPGDPLIPPTPQGNRGLAVFPDGEFGAGLDMRRIDGQSFSLLSFAAYEVDQEITVRGLYGGEYVQSYDGPIDYLNNETYSLTTSQLLSTDLAYGWKRYYLPEHWADLDIVHFVTSAGGQEQFILDDITVTTVPVPAAAWLFGSALAGLGWMRRKQTV